MAILPPEPSLYPEALFDRDVPLDGDGRWWVLHTRPRQEKALARDLHAQGVAFFLPLLTKTTRIRTRDVPVYLPLFSGYLFLHADVDGLMKAHGTTRVARALEVIEQEQLWDDLQQVHGLIRSGQPIIPEAKLAPGMPVEICSGPLMGLRGVVVRSASGNRFVVQVHFIQRGASVMIHSEMLEPALV